MLFCFLVLIITEVISRPKTKACSLLMYKGTKKIFTDF